MNSLIRLLAIFTTLFIIWTRNSFADGAPVLDRIQKTGKRILGTTRNMPLMSEKILTGDVIGYDIDLATALATSMGAELEIKVLPFDKQIHFLDNGNVDIVLSNMTMTVNRNMHVTFPVLI